MASSEKINKGVKIMSRVFCPVCKKSFKLRFYKNKTSNYIALATFIIGTSVLLFFGKLHMQLFFLIFPLMIIIDYGKRLNARLSFTCPHCAFDLISFKHDKKRAVSRISESRNLKKKSFEKLINL